MSVESVLWHLTGVTFTLIDLYMGLPCSHSFPSIIRCFPPILCRRMFNLQFVLNVVHLYLSLATRSVLNFNVYVCTIFTEMNTEIATAIQINVQELAALPLSEI